jgi:hypothetical protein
MGNDENTDAEGSNTWVDTWGFDSDAINRRQMRARGRAEKMMEAAKTLEGIEALIWQARYCSESTKSIEDIAGEFNLTINGIEEIERSLFQKVWLLTRPPDTD